MIDDRLLVDTNALIHQLSGDDRIGSLLKGKNIHISFVTQIELLSWPGYTAAERSVVAGLLKAFVITDASEGIKMHAIDLRIRHKLKFADALITATAIHLNIPLVTQDKHFHRLKNEVTIYWV